jgi:succinyl-diaminopimelate desuccinylase
MKYFDPFIKNLMALLSIDTVQSEAKPYAPFGEGNKKALDFVLDLARDLGFKTRNLDGYIGYAELGGSDDQSQSSDDIPKNAAGNSVLNAQIVDQNNPDFACFDKDDYESVGILGHLDTVPIGRNWTKNPYGEIADGIVYGRGTVDDKGPILACLFAAKEIFENRAPKKRLRIIFGCNEESGWKCIEHYLKHEKMPSVGFSPDADFPVINREKGIVNFELLFALPEDISICGGERPNVVPSHCEAEVAGEKFETKGKSAHAAHAYEGENAVVKMFEKLSDKHPLFELLAQSFSDVFGANVGLKQADFGDGALILNVGVAQTIQNDKKLKNGNTALLAAPKLLRLVIDIRYPETITEDEVRQRLAQHFKDCEITKTHFHLPLFVDKDTFLVKTLLSVYNDMTGENASPITIGGGTYARALPCGVAFGPIFPDKPLSIHCPDENMPLEQMKLMYKIYGEAIRRLTISGATRTVSPE